MTNHQENFLLSLNYSAKKKNSFPMIKFFAEEIVINPTLTITVLNYANTTEPKASARRDCHQEGVMKH